MTKDEIAVTKVMYQLVVMANCSPPNSRMGEWSVQCLRFLEEGQMTAPIGQNGIKTLIQCGTRTDYKDT